MQSDSAFRSFFESVAVGLRSSAALRHFCNRRRFPGLNIHPRANLSIQGKFAYGDKVSFGEGCNLVVPSGAELRLGNECYVGRYVELGPLGAIDIGGQTSIQDRTIIVGDVELGRYCVVSLNVLMTSGTHYHAKWPMINIRDQDVLVANDPELSKKHSRKISIGEDCWLGINSVVMPGVSIGRGCVIGANAVVTHDLSPYSVAAGVPARVINRRLTFAPPFSIDWRDTEHLPYFYSGFELAAAERSRNEPLQGHLACNRFALWLANGRSELWLRVRTASGPTAILDSYGRQEAVGPEWQDVRFPIDGDGAPRSFRIEGAAVVVSGAWLK